MDKLRLRVDFKEEQYNIDVIGMFEFHTLFTPQDAYGDYCSIGAFLLPEELDKLNESTHVHTCIFDIVEKQGIQVVDCVIDIKKAPRHLTVNLIES